jgi:hypothetical protein
MFKKGDRVRILNNGKEGVVLKIQPGIVYEILIDGGEILCHCEVSLEKIVLLNNYSFSI